MNLKTSAACVAIVIVLHVQGGCQSSVRQASRAANMVRDMARASESRFKNIGEEIASPEPNAARISSEAAAGEIEQRRIQQLAGGIQLSLTATEDRPSPWISVLNLWGWIALVAVAVFVLGYFGMAALIRRVLTDRISRIGSQR